MAEKYAPIQGVPDAATLIALQSAWLSIPGPKFDRAYPFFGADIDYIAKEYGLGSNVVSGHPNYCEAVALLFAHYADELYWQERGAPETTRQTPEDNQHG